MCFLLAQPEGLFNILCSPVTLSPEPAGLCWDFYCFICFSYDDDDVDCVTCGDVHKRVQGPIASRRGRQRPWS